MGRSDLGHHWLPIGHDLLTSTHTVDDSALVQVLRVYYSALPASPGDIVTVGLYDHDLEIIDAAGQLLRRHTRSWGPLIFASKSDGRICR
jgi:hypothetical protein